IVAIMYTSGTTGPSKGVRVAHAHAYMYANLAGQTLELAPDDVYYAPLPLFHIAGQWALVYACLQVGATAIVRRRFSATELRSPGVRLSAAHRRRARPRGAGGQGRRAGDPHRRALDHEHRLPQRPGGNAGRLAQPLAALGRRLPPRR